MNKYLKSVNEFQETLLFPLTKPGTTLSDMQIIHYQALLMETGSDVLKAIKEGEMTELASGLINLAYAALAAIAIQGGDISDKPVLWQQDWSVLSVMKKLSEQINQCISGHPDNYSEVYTLCLSLVRGFVNADFDKGFQMVHNNIVANVTISEEFINSDINFFTKLKLQNTPDFSECLYE